MLDDYISCLLNWLQETPPNRESAYAAQQQREKQAAQALLETFSKSQHKLFLEYEEQRNFSASMENDTSARQAFLLARDIFRA